MSEQQNQPYPYQPIPGVYSAPPNPGVPGRPKRKRHTGRWVVAGLVAVAIAGGAGAAGTSGSSNHGGKKIPPVSTRHATPAASKAAPAVETPTEDPGPVYVTPTVRDFTVTLKILDKQCFGDAGCNITFRPVLSMARASGSFDPDVTYDVTYVVRGGDSGPQTATLTVTGDQYEQPSEDFISTASQAQKLTVKVAAVESQG